MPDYLPNKKAKSPFFYSEYDFIWYPTFLVITLVIALDITLIVFSARFFRFTTTTQYFFGICKSFVISNLIICVFFCRFSIFLVKTYQCQCRHHRFLLHCYACHSILTFSSHSFFGLSCRNTHYNPTLFISYVLFIW